MKTAIHPQLTENVVTCASCGTVWCLTTAARVDAVEVCAACHPAYTGEDRGRPRGSRIERFERRRARAEEQA